MGYQLSWLEHTPDKGEVSGSSPEQPTGGIAQLVERCLCTADVSGSSPLTSKNSPLQNFENCKIYYIYYIQANKSLSWIPWHSEAMKGVSTNEMLRGAGRKL